MNRVLGGTEVRQTGSVPVWLKHHIQKSSPYCYTVSGDKGHTQDLIKRNAVSLLSSFLSGGILIKFGFRLHSDVTPADKSKVSVPVPKQVLEKHSDVAGGLSMMTL